MRILLYIMAVLFLGFTFVCGGCFVGGGMVCNSVNTAIQKKAMELKKEKQEKEAREENEQIKKENQETQKAVKEKATKPNQNQPSLTPEKDKPEPIQPPENPAPPVDLEAEKKKETETKQKEFQKNWETYQEEIQELGRLEKRYKEMGAKALKAETVEDETMWKKASQDAYAKYKSLKTELDTKKKDLEKEKKKLGL
jgi:hypothetical protein